MPTTTELLSQALELSDSDRARLARNLLQSLDPPAGPAEDEAASLAVLLQQRLARIDSGEASRIDVEEAMSQLTEAHRRRMLRNSE